MPNPSFFIKNGETMSPNILIRKTLFRYMFQNDLSRESNKFLSIRLYLKHAVKDLNKHAYIFPGKSRDVCDHPALFLTNNHAILKCLLASYSTVVID